MDVPVAANVLGTAGAICWSVQLLPQIFMNYRRHDTTGLQPSMMLLWACAGVPLGVYNIVENFNLALRIQPQILTFLSLLTWMQCKYYSSKWPASKAFAVAVPVAGVMGGIEYGLVFGLQRAKQAGLDWPSILMAVLAACLLCAGVLRHYWDIYQEKTVRGISFIFVAIDAAGDLTSLISVFFEPKLDVLGMIIYGSELVLWCGVMICGCVFNLPPWIRKHMQKSEALGVETGERVDAVTEHPGQEQSAPEDSSSVFRTASSSSSVVQSAELTEEVAIGNNIRLRHTVVGVSDR